MKEPLRSFKSNYSWCNQVFWSPQKVRKNTSKRRVLLSEVSTSNRRWTCPVKGITSDWRWTPPIGGLPSDWKYHLWSQLWSEVSLGYWQEGEGVTGVHLLGHKGLHMFTGNYAKGWSRYGESCRHVHVLVHAHILTKVWDQNRGDWNLHTGWHSSTHFCTQLCKGVGADMESWLDIHTHTDACTHSNQYIGPEYRWLEHTCGGSQGCTCLSTITCGESGGNA